jgi:hypothetical protein
MITVQTDPGICGLPTTVKASSEDMQNVKIEIDSKCPDIMKAAEEIKEVNAMEEVFGKIGENAIYTAAKKHCNHVSCPVPAAIVKAVEAAAGLALPKDVVITMEKSD